MTRPWQERLSEKLVESEELFNGTPCWLFTGYLNKHGHGILHVNGKSQFTHRLLYADTHGPVTGLILKHLCGVKNCSNPAHLIPVTYAENCKGGMASLPRWGRKKTHCPQRHPYDAENTLVGPNGDRSCRACRRARGVAWRATHPKKSYYIKVKDRKPLISARA